MMTLPTLIAGIAMMAAPPMQGQLLKVGAKAPDFALKTPQGKTIRFSTVYKSKKATIVNFWFFH